MEVSLSTMPVSLSECREIFQRVHRYQQNVHESFKDQQYPYVDDCLVLKDLITSEEARLPNFTGKYFTTTRELLTHVQANEEFDKPIVGVLKIDRTPHHLQVESVKHSSNSEWTVLALDSVPLKSRGCKHLLRPIVASIGNIVEELGDAKGAVGVLGTQKAPRGCSMYSLAGLELSSELQPEMMAIHRQINQSGTLSSTKPPVEDPYEDISNNMIDEDMPLQIRDAASAVPLAYYGYASSRSTLGNLQTMRPDLALKKAPIALGGKIYSSIFSCYEENAQKRLLDVFDEKLKVVNTRIEKFRLEVASGAVDYWLKQMNAMENNVSTESVN